MEAWRLTRLYGESGRAQCGKTWDLLQTLVHSTSLPWCVIGDVNNVVDQIDKQGGAPYPGWLVDRFNKALKDVGLRDMELVGYLFTWDHGRVTSKFMEIRIDQALVTST
uniref:Endonuclease/exonuclease/phosphatase domain-containing protein n=1 Tax=Cannabis sativa TaxID=3483 RepID=A0A803PJH9_CANSA